MPTPETTPTTPRTLARDAGLTLLELLVVVTILVLLTVAIGTVAINYLGGAQAKAARLQLSQIEGALDLYRLDMGRYPTEAEGLDALVEAPAGANQWSGPYIAKRATLTDPWDREFTYRVPGEGGRAYALYSLGADGQEGGEDDAADIRSE